MTVMKRKSFKINMSTQRICDRNSEALYWDTAAMRHAFLHWRSWVPKPEKCTLEKDVGGRATSEAIGWVRA